EQPDRTLVDLDNDDDVERRRLSHAMAAAAAQVHNRNDCSPEIEDAADIIRLLWQPDDLRPAFDLTHRHDVDTVLVVTNGKADELRVRGGRTLGVSLPRT